MRVDNRVFRVRGRVQHYAWGGFEFIPSLIGITPEENMPYAEYWLGAHQSLPSDVLFPDGGSSALDRFIDTFAPEVLGREVLERFRALPFLLKVLDVREMLSIQVHPTKQQAREGFDQENEMGIPLESPKRNYKDRNHKPEIMVALTDFWLLHGFLTKDKLSDVLSRVPELRTFRAMFDERGYYGLYKYVMELPDPAATTLLHALASRLLPHYTAGDLDKSSADYWVARYIHTNGLECIDRGLLSIYFFNVVQLAKGEAIFQDAGVPHAYLEGANVELMANSDNVLRGGLTKKHVDLSELLKLIRFEETRPAVLKGIAQPDGLETRFETTSPDFLLSAITLEQGATYQRAARSADLLLLLHGAVRVGRQDDLHLKRGDAILVCAGQEYTIACQSNSATLYKATIP